MPRDYKKLQLQGVAGSYGSQDGEAKDTGSYAGGRVGVNVTPSLNVGASARGGRNRFRAPGVQETGSDVRFGGVDVTYKNKKRKFAVTGELSDDMRAPGSTRRGTKGVKLTLKKEF